MHKVLLKKLKLLKWPVHVFDNVENDIMKTLRTDKLISSAKKKLILSSQEE